MVWSFQCNEKELLWLSITADETWIHYYQSETKEVKIMGCSKRMWSKKAETFPSADNIMATVLCDAHDINLIDFLDKS